MAGKNRGGRLQPVECEFDPLTSSLQRTPHERFARANENGLDKVVLGFFAPPEAGKSIGRQGVFLVDADVFSGGDVLTAHGVAIAGCWRGDVLGFGVAAL